MTIAVVVALAIAVPSLSFGVGWLVGGSDMHRRLILRGWHASRRIHIFVGGENVASVRTDTPYIGTLFDGLIKKAHVTVVLGTAPDGTAPERV